MTKRLPLLFLRLPQSATFFKNTMLLALCCLLGSLNSFASDADVSVRYETDWIQITHSASGEPMIGTISYILIVTNNGPDEATNLNIASNYHDEVIAFDRVMSTGYWDSYQWIIPSLPAGATATLTESSNVYVPYNDKWVQASLLSMDQDDPDSTPGNWDFSEDDSDQLEIRAPKSDLRLTLEPDDYVYEAFEQVRYEVTLRNSGPSAATNVSVSFPLPPGMVFSASSATHGVYELYYESWNIGTLEAGQIATLTLDLFPLDEDSPKTAFVQVQTVDQPDPDSSPGNDVDQIPDEDDEARITVYDMASAFSDLYINAFPTYPDFEPGEHAITYFDLGNVGPLGVSTGIRVTAYLSTDENLSPDDVPIGEVITLEEIDPFYGLSEVGLVITIPLGTASGHYYVIYLADSDFSLAESDENNNTDFTELDVISSSSCSGDVVLTSQAEVDAFPTCTVYDGSITIEGNDITDFSVFNTLEEITGSLKIQYCYDLEDLDGFHNLESVGENLYIIYNDDLISIDAFSTIENIGETFAIVHNPVLNYIENMLYGFGADRFVFIGNDQMTNLDAFGGSLIRLNRLEIESNERLENVNGMLYITPNMGEISLQHNPSLQNINGLSNITSVNGDLTLINLGFVESHPFHDLYRVGGDLTIAGNNYLERLTGYYNLYDVGGYLQIADNPMLSECCDIFPILDEGGVSGDIIFSNNLPTCNSANEILDSCSTGTYCDSYGYFPWHEWISQVTFNTIDNASGKSQYSDFTGLSTTVQKGENYEIALQTSYSFFTYDEYWRVWIDFDQNGSFSDQGELVFDQMLERPEDGTAFEWKTGNINIPVDALSGDTRMRISMQRGSAAMPCATLPFGEVEDYTVTISGTAPAVLTLECPNDVVVNIPEGSGGTIVNWDLPTYSSTCPGGSVSLTQTGGQANDSYFPEGTYFIEYTATDNCGNEEICTFVLSLVEVSGYCDSQSDFPWHEWISGVSFNTMSNTSGKSHYSDFTGLSTSAQKGETYSIALRTSYSYYTYDEYWRVWIDFNQNGSFTDPGEMVYDQLMERPADGTPSVWEYGDISIPADALSGNTRMRVAMQRDNAPTPCATLPFGEVEDYTVNILDAGLLPELNIPNYEVIQQAGYSNCYSEIGRDFGFLGGTIVNFGDAASAPFKVKITISKDDQISNDDVLWQEIQHPGLEPNPNAGSFTLTNFVPAFLDPGVYYAIIQLDSDNEVEELYEDNNVIISEIQLDAPDYTITGVSGVPSSASPGSTFSFNSRITNLLPFPLLELTDDLPIQVFLSENEQLDTYDDFNIGSATVSYDQFSNAPLFEDGTVNADLSATIPMGIADGEYYLFTYVGVTCEFDYFNDASDPYLIRIESGAPVDYCESFSDFPWHEWIGRVEFAGISNYSDKSKYSDFTTMSAVVEKGGNYPISLQSDFSYTTYDEYWRVWIDFNQNGSFYDAGEMVFDELLSGPPDGTAFATITGDVAIPNNALEGNTRMRVAMQRGSAPSPCDVIPFGEVEDYSVNIADSFGGSAAQMRANVIELELFPNPVLNEVFVNLYKHAGQSATLKIYDMYGHTILERQIEEIPNYPIRLDLSTVENGLYFFSTRVDNLKISTQRIVVEKTR